MVFQTSPEDECTATVLRSGKKVTELAYKASVVPCPLCNETSAILILKRIRFNSEWALARCNACSLHFTEPLPTPENLNVFYSGDYHSELRKVGRTEAAFGKKFNAYFHFIRDHVPPGSGTLDVGCATGLFPKMLQDFGYRAEGVELNPDSAKWGQEYYKVPIHQGTIDTLAESGRKFDFVSMTDVLEHTVSPPKDVLKVRRMLNPGGHFMVTFPDILSLSSRYLRLLSICTRREDLWGTCHIPLHTWEFSYATAMRLFTQNGFRLVKFRRCQAYSFEPSLSGLASLPANIAALPGVRLIAGNQMEFLLCKIGDEPV